VTGGTFFSFTVGRSGGSGQHLEYISRESAVIGEKGVQIFEKNIPEYVFKRESYEEQRENIIHYGRSREKVEVKGRTHYRALFSFEKEVSPEKAFQMVREFLEKAMPEAKAIGFFHQNTENRHVHVWIDARGQDEKKLQFSNRDYKSLDEKWNVIYSREMGRNYTEHLEKKEAGSERIREETREKSRESELSEGNSREPQIKGGERAVENSSGEIVRESMRDNGGVRQLQDLHDKVWRLRGEVNLYVQNREREERLDRESGLQKGDKKDSYDRER
jgi:hypothetical protein